MSQATVSKTAKKRLTYRQRVLRKFPNARIVPMATQFRVDTGPSTFDEIIGYGKTRSDAWFDACEKTNP